jgi:hypothetical protein
MPPNYSIALDELQHLQALGQDLTFLEMQSCRLQQPPLEPLQLRTGLQGLCLRG